MPLVKIDVIKGRRSPTQLRALADVVQSVMLQDFKAPPKDRYQVSLPAGLISFVVLADVLEKLTSPDHNATRARRAHLRGHKSRLREDGRSGRHSNLPARSDR